MMPMPEIGNIQKELRQAHLDGWLFCDHHHRDPIAYRILGLAENLATRRWFYFIPARGQPKKLVHRIESGMLDSLPGKKAEYSAWPELAGRLRGILGRAKTVAMQYSPNNAIPVVSLVDAGTLELVRSFRKKVVSSADLVQLFEARWTPQQLDSHLAAGVIVDGIMADAFKEIAFALGQGRELNEFELQQWILDRFHKLNLETDDPPIVAVNRNSSNPHYQPTARLHLPIRRNDFVLLDIWAKQKLPHAVYYDITWTGFVGRETTPRHRQIFEIVREARDRAVDFVQESVSRGRPIAGWQVDDVCRRHIRRKGFGKYFTHRTGHSIGRDVHGNGANMDNFETHDTRPILPGTCFSIEPGIYLPEFGIRSEVDVYVDASAARVTGTVQQQPVPILAL